ncbi:MAG: hypothetical protein MJA31_11720 [Clostridia bacterium]|nr:hypothetical protein [Clostridia bacterium]
MNLFKKSLLLIMALSISVLFLVGCSDREDPESISVEESILEKEQDFEEELSEENLDSEEDSLNDEPDIIQEESDAIIEKESKTESKDLNSEETKNISTDQKTLKEKDIKLNPEEDADMFLEKFEMALNDLVEDGTISADKSQTVLDSINTSFENNVQPKDILSELVTDNVITQSDADAIKNKIGGHGPKTKND